jgi:hypothetical protein
MPRGGRRVAYVIRVRCDRARQVPARRISYKNRDRYHAFALIQRTGSTWADDGSPTDLGHGGNARNDEERTMVEGWTRVCPECGNSDGAKVERIAFRPVFRCECGYVWDSSNAVFLGVWNVDRDTDREELADAIINAVSKWTSR